MTDRIRHSGVYKITNKINGKFYVGSSIHVGNRWDQHRYEARRVGPTRSVLHASMRKYGAENFVFELLEECEATRERLLQREQFYLDLLKPPYNTNPTAESRLGAKHTPDGLANLSRANKRNGEKYRKGKTFVELFGEGRAAEIAVKKAESRKLRPTVCAGWNKGIPADPEQIARMNAARDGMEPWNKNQPMSSELRAKLQTAGFWHVTDERRQHQSQARLGKDPWNKDQIMGEAYGQAMAVAAQARHEARPELQAQLTEAARQANTGKPRSAEAKAAISAGNLASEARKAFAESQRGVARPDVGRKVAETLATSEKAKAYHDGRIGKTRGNSASGHYGVIYDKSRNKYQVRVHNKSYGRFDRLEDAVAKVAEVRATLGMTECA